MLLKRFALALMMTASLLSLTAYAQEDEFAVETDSAFEAWCAQGTRVLSRAQQQAQQQVAYGQFSAAANTLLTALNRGVTRPSWSIKPVTWKLMVHGKNMGTAMLNASGSDVRGIKATVNALESIYDLILESANEIDRPYYRSNCGYCRGQGVEAFERRVLRMSGDLLALVNGNLTHARGGQVFPLGPSRSYLVGAEVAATGALAEISELLYAEAYACELLELEGISQELSIFNRRSASEHERVGMFYDTFGRLDDVIIQLRQGQGCNYRRH